LKRRNKQIHRDCFGSSVDGKSRKKHPINDCIQYQTTKTSADILFCKATPTSCPAAASRMTLALALTAGGAHDLADE
jgi:hypothetical protein